MIAKIILMVFLSLCLHPISYINRNISYNYINSLSIGKMNFWKLLFLKNWDFGFSPCKSDFRKNEIFVHLNCICRVTTRILPSIVSWFSKIQILKKWKFQKCDFQKVLFSHFPLIFVRDYMSHFKVKKWFLDLFQ